MTTSTNCDNCGNVQSEEVDDNEESVDKWWDVTPPEGWKESKDFCSAPCLAEWAAKQANPKVDLSD